MYVINKKISRVKSGKGPSDDIRTRKSVSLNTGGPEVVNQIFKAMAQYDIIVQWNKRENMLHN